MECGLRRFARHLTQRPRLAAFILVGLTGMSLIGVARLTIDPANEQLFIHHSESYQVYQRFRATFGSDETLLVALHAPSQALLTPDGLAAVRRLTQALLALPHVAAVLSLTNAPDLARLRRCR